MIILLVGLIIAYTLLFKSRSLVSHMMLMQNPSTLFVELVLMGLALYNPLTLILLAGVVYMSLRKPNTANYLWAGFGAFVLIAIMGLCIYVIVHGLMA